MIAWLIIVTILIAVLFFFRRSLARVAFGKTEKSARIRTGIFAFLGGAFAVYLAMMAILFLLALSGFFSGGHGHALEALGSFIFIPIMFLSVLNGLLWVLIVLRAKDGIPWKSLGISSACILSVPAAVLVGFLALKTVFFAAHWNRHEAKDISPVETIKGWKLGLFGWKNLEYQEIDILLLDSKDNRQIAGAVIKVTWNAVKRKYGRGWIGIGIEDIHSSIAVEKYVSDSSGFCSVPFFLKREKVKRQAGMGIQIFSKDHYGQYLWVKKDAQPVFINRPHYTPGKMEWNATSRLLKVWLTQRENKLQGNHVVDILRDGEWIWICVRPRPPEGESDKPLWSRYNLQTKQWDVEAPKPPSDVISGKVPGKGVREKEPSVADTDGSIWQVVNEKKEARPPVSGLYSVLLHQDPGASEPIQRISLEHYIYPLGPKTLALTPTYVWLIGTGGKLFRIDKKSGAIRQIGAKEGLRSPATVMLVDMSYLWVGTQSGGVNRLDLDSGRWAYFHY